MTADFELEEATIDGIHAAIRAGELTASDLVRGYLTRLEAHGPALNAVLATSEHALARAEELDREFAGTGELAGPLHGIPVALKDNIETADMATTFGSVAMDGYRPREDATVTRRLREAGAIILIKTTLPDWATSWFSYSSISNETRNPYDLDRDPGGSSSGTGAASPPTCAPSASGPTAAARSASRPHSATWWACAARRASCRARAPPTW